jgi:hypothetical protein
MEALQFREELTVRDDCTMQIGMIVFAHNVQRQLLEGVGTKAECAVNIAFRRCWFSGVRFITIDEENVPRRSCVPGSPIRVLLNAFLHKTDYKMLMRMTCESVLDVMRMNDLSVIWMPDAKNASPLWGCCHEKQLSHEVSQ